MRPVKFAPVLVMGDSPKPGGQVNSLNPPEYPIRKSIYYPISVRRSGHSIPSVAKPAMDLQYILAPVVERSKGRTPSPPPRPPPFHLLPSPTSYPLPCPGVPTPPGLEPSRPPRPFVPHSDDVILAFDTTTHSFPRPSKQNVQSHADPYAENFLRDMIGPEKWEIFSSRLFERRLGARAKGKGKGRPGEEDDNRSGVSAIEFLVKVEIVKDVLRTFVPHPYNPLKSLTHSYPAAPSGQVTLTRSTVLALSGWSNTQFSYWARRAEAVSVLGEYDSRLHAVGVALENRLRGDNTIPQNSEAYSVTGKGLDAIIDEVKKRTGKSQFLRGKHSSLDPYGTTVADTDQSMYPAPLFAMPTFQAEYYNHWVRFPVLRKKMPPSMYPNAVIDPPSAPKKSVFSHPSPYPLDPLEYPSRAGDSEDSMSSPLMASPSDMPSPVISEVLTLDHDDSGRSSRVLPSIQPDDTPSYFPLSESRLDMSLDNPVNKRKPSEPDAAYPKRTRPFFNNGSSASASDDEF